MREEKRVRAEIEQFSKRGGGLIGAEIKKKIWQRPQGGVAGWAKTRIPSPQTSTLARAPSRARLGSAPARSPPRAAVAWAALALVGLFSESPHRRRSYRPCSGLVGQARRGRPRDRMGTVGVPSLSVVSFSRRWSWCPTETLTTTGPRSA